MLHYEVRKQFMDMKFEEVISNAQPEEYIVLTNSETLLVIEVLNH